MAKSGTMEKEALGKLLFCAYLMAAIDGYMDDDELMVIRDFASQHWDSSPEELEALLEQVDKEVTAFLIPYDAKQKLTLEEQVFRFFPGGAAAPMGESHQDNFLTLIAPSLNREQAYVLLELLTQVMNADEIQEEAEKSLIRRYKAYLEADGPA